MWEKMILTHFEVVKKKQKQFSSLHRFAYVKIVLHMRDT